MKYGSVADATTNLNMTVAQIRAQYIEFQKQLYSVA
jgi:type I restriction enzyme R subunit